MQKLIIRLKRLKDELKGGKNEGDIQGIYWRLHSLIDNNDFKFKNVYLKRFNEIDNIDYSSLVERNRGRLTGLINQILDDVEDLSHRNEIFKTASHNKKRAAPDNPPNFHNHKVFIVHGHNELMKQSVARLIEKIGLEAVILHEQPNQGLTVIEKFISNSSVDFAIVLLSADDIAYNAQSGQQSAKHRARQNVIFELGYFIGKTWEEASYRFS
jgi:hypothetical protein